LEGDLKPEKMLDFLSFPILPSRIKKPARQVASDGFRTGHTHAHTLISRPNL
jgi:hypothetical protein